MQSAANAKQTPKSPRARAWESKSPVRGLLASLAGDQPIMPMRPTPIQALPADPQFQRVAFTGRKGQAVS